MHVSARSDLLLVLVTLMAAAGWMFTKEALAFMPPLLFMCVRFSLAGLILVALDWRAIQAFTLHSWKIALFAGCLFGAAMSLWIQGVYSSQHLGEGSFITSLAVVFVPWIGWLVYQERPSTSTFLALPPALVGMALLSLQHGFRVEPAQLYFLSAAILLAITFTINARAATHMPPLALTAVQLLMVGVIAGISAYWRNETVSDSMSHPPTMMLVWLVLSILVSTSGRFALQTHAQGMVSAGHAAAIMILEPVWTALLAALWFGEQTSLLQALGCGCILTALVMQRWRWVAKLLGFKPQS